MLTLNEKKIGLIEKVKPFIKYVTTIDFGKVVYAKEFYDLL